ncbi:MAG: hypothetical protein HYY37_04705 [Candidatus Aenigmarchaeota archaeon]|nr:hypothetical protein [Candidatus Aenigmarchaeota archaeon]
MKLMKVDTIPLVDFCPSCGSAQFTREHAAAYCVACSLVILKTVSPDDDVDDRRVRRRNHMFKRLQGINARHII